MRIAVLDAGSQAVNLVVASPAEVRKWKARTGLAARITGDGTIDARGRRDVAEAVTRAAGEVAKVGADCLIAYATATIRDAPNRDQVLHRVREASGVALGTFSGVEEARLTYRAARRWHGVPADPVLLLDIGGGTVEVAAGSGARPDVAVSVPLGAARLTREFLSGPERSSPAAVRRLRRYVRSQLGEVAGRFPPAAPVAASAVFRQLARLTAGGARAPLYRRDLKPWIERLAAMPARRRAGLPGVSPHRCGCLVAGAVVADELMRALSLDAVPVCPWGLRDGIVWELLDGGPLTG